MAEQKDYRWGVVGVFRNNKGEILMAERSDSPNAWQFVQGGIDPGEDPDVAVLRETCEEIGISNCKILARASSTTSYDFPPTATFRIAREYRGQKHFWYLLEYDEKSPADLSKSDGEFSRLRWTNPLDALENIVSWKLDAYAQGLVALGIISAAELDSCKKKRTT